MWRVHVCSDWTIESQHQYPWWTHAYIVKRNRKNIYSNLVLFVKYNSRRGILFPSKHQLKCTRHRVSDQYKLTRLLWSKLACLPTCSQDPAGGIQQKSQSLMKKYLKMITTRSLCDEESCALRAVVDIALFLGSTKQILILNRIDRKFSFIVFASDGKGNEW